MPREVPCPLCKKPSLFSPENEYRPFCSKRCRLTDLGAWANEEYAIPTAQSPNGQSLPGEDSSPVAEADDGFMPLPKRH
jgi:uncharacterized protein